MVTGRQSRRDFATGVSPHNVPLVMLYICELLQADEFHERRFADVENTHDTSCSLCVAAACPNLAKCALVVALVDLSGCSYVCSKDDPFHRRSRSHLVDQIQVVLPRLIGEAYGAPGHAACCSVEPGIGVIGLEHVPIGQNVQMLRHH